MKVAPIFFLVFIHQMVHTLSMVFSTLGNSSWLREAKWSPIDGRGLRLWTTAFVVRALGFMALGVGALVIPAVGPDRFWVGISLLVAAAPYNLALVADLRKRHRLRSLTPFFDIAAASIFNFIFEDVWTPVLLVALVSVGLAAVGFGSRLAFWVTAFAAASFTLSGTFGDVDDPIVGVITFLISALMIVLTVGIVTDSERESRLRFTGLVEGIDAVVWEADLGSRTLLYISPRAETMFGYPMEDWRTPGFFMSRIHRDDRDEVMARGAILFEEGKDLQMEFRVNAADGRVVWVRNFMSAAAQDSDRSHLIRGVMVDISGQKADEQIIGQYNDIVENMQVGLFVWQMVEGQEDRQEESLRLVAGNPAACSLLGRSLDSVIGCSFHDVFPELRDSAVGAQIIEVIKTAQPAVLNQIDYVDREGDRVAMFLRVFPLPNGCAGFAFEDVTTQMHAEEALRYQAMHDALTDLPNRSLFNERLGWVLAEGLRRRSPVSLLLIDLDEFKEVNDTFGHLVGDELLRQVGQRLRLLLRESDMVARFGGDEFAVLLTTAADESAAREVAAKILAAFAEPFHINDLVLYSSPSIGIARYPENASEPDKLIQQADSAMYTAKRSGSGFAFYIEDEDHANGDRVGLLGEISQAVDRDQLEVHFLPKIALDSGDVVDVEALVRWRHPIHGLLRPVDFIELAELSGAIQELDRQVISTGLSQHSLWSSLDLNVGLAVNLSIKNLYDPALLAHLESEFARSDIDPNDVIFELSERDLIQDLAQAALPIGRLGDLGVRLAIDDFGLGASSLAGLRELPVSEIKIDRSFISTMLSDESSDVIVRSIVDLGHNLGFKVTAEGVESIAALDHLIEMGCDYAQGFQISEALSSDDLLSWFARRGGPSGWGLVRI